MSANVGLITPKNTINENSLSDDIFVLVKYSIQYVTTSTNPCTKFQACVLCDDRQPGIPDRILLPKLYLGLSPWNQCEWSPTDKLSGSTRIQSNCRIVSLKNIAPYFIGRGGRGQPKPYTELFTEYQIVVCASQISFGLINHHWVCIKSYPPVKDTTICFWLKIWFWLVDRHKVGNFKLVLVSIQ